MSAAETIFDQIKGFRTTPAEKTPHQRFTDYCERVLGAVERFHIDFKEKRDRRTTVLDDDDKKNLAKAISGFANSAGGVLIWGVEDNTLSERPLSSVEDVTSRMLELAAHVTEPSVIGVDGDWVPADTGDGDGFVVLYIPESDLPPHRVTLKHQGIQNNYYVRSGNSFVAASHTQLEDMFGRRPHPKLGLAYRVICDGGVGKGSNIVTKYVKIVLSIANQGRGIARYPFLVVQVREPYDIHQWGIDGNGRFGLPTIAVAKDSREHRYGGQGDLVIHPEMSHDVTAMRIAVHMADGQAGITPLAIDYKLGAEGIRLIKSQLTVQPSEIWSVCK